MNKIHIQIMFYLDKHLDGRELTWKGYDNLIKLILKEHADKEVKLELELTKLKHLVEILKEAICSSSSKVVTRVGRQHSLEKLKNS